MRAWRSGSTWRIARTRPALSNALRTLCTQGSNDAILAGLVRALDDILELQAELRPQGESRILTAEHIAARIAKVAESLPTTYRT